MTWQLSAPDPPASRPRSMPPPKVSRSSSSTRAPSADRQGRARGSKIIAAFLPGISGRALTGRAYVQAQKFGARMMIPTEVVQLDLTENPVALHLDDGRRVKASTVVVATGARYRRLNVPNLQD